jgi:hypothetical protein
MDNPNALSTLDTQDTGYTVNIGHTGHGDILSTLDTQDTGYTVNIGHTGHGTKQTQYKKQHNTEH